MSAYLDKSQGITFVYSNLYEIQKRAKETRLDSPFVVSNERVIKKIDAEAKSFQPAELKAREDQRPFAVPMGVREAEEKARRANARPIANLQKNLSELTDAHEKLRFLLRELETLTKKK